MSQDLHIHWFRRDLRFHDNRALIAACEKGFAVQCIFIFDSEILQFLPRNDRRVSLIYDRLEKMHQKLCSVGSSLQVFHGNPTEIFPSILQDQNIKAVFCGRGYEVYDKKRDGIVENLCKDRGVDFHAMKDHVVYDHGEILKPDGNPYTVYTPYMRKWKEKFFRNKGSEIFFTPPLDPEIFAKNRENSFPELASLGFDKSSYGHINKRVEIDWNKYAKNRDFPALSATSHMSTALRFGFVSIRELAVEAAEKSDAFLNELIWREFFNQVLDHFPEVEKNAFRKEYDHIKWRDAPQDLEKWCQGKTGYPLVDAGMRELLQTGLMHNRIRMVTASFLVKHLLIDWRIGEAWFAQHLLDFDLASNNGNWQWVAGSGTDTSPYFRIFNPVLQQQKFDPDFEYVKKWVPELGTSAYPDPMVDHRFARERCLNAYSVVKQVLK